jgi:hypothetical protein
MYAKRVSVGSTNINALICCGLNYLAFLRPEADRTDFAFPCITCRSRSYEFLWADSDILWADFLRKEIQLWLVRN